MNFHPVFVPTNLLLSNIRWQGWQSVKAMLRLVEKKGHQTWQTQIWRERKSWVTQLNLKSQRGKHYAIYKLDFYTDLMFFDLIVKQV